MPAANDHGRGGIERSDLLDLRSLTKVCEQSEWSVLESRDIDGQTREGERAGAKESMG